MVFTRIVSVIGLKKLTYLLPILAVGVLMACEDVINPNLQKADPVLVVDAWITNLPDSQKIFLSRTQPYFENLLPPAVAGATVTVTDQNGVVYSFIENKPGEYVWVPSGSNTFGQVGLRYQLQISTGGEIFNAESVMGVAPPVDSITFYVQKGNQFVDDLYLAEFWAKDPDEPGNSYWIRTYKNGILLNKPSEIVTAYDAGFSKGGNFGGVQFIAPIRRSINPFDTDANGNFLSPYQVGDSVFVQLHSVTEAAFNFLNEVAVQTNRPGGFGELFSTPLANVSTNIRNAQAAGSKAVGFFNVAAVTGLGRKFNSLDDLTEN
ncbi:MAG: DUF4249 domain-containing protein [Cytophagales bacterium]|nr:DUF4249 domain-containing protein [Cytophagales bacterium]